MSSGRPEARRGRPGYDQATVVARAVEVFNERGYDATSMADLAAELGIGKSTLYHHVPGKEHLLAAALETALGGLESVLTTAESSAAEPIDRLRRAVRDAVMLLVEELPSVTLLLRVRGNSEAERRALARRRAIDERLTLLVRAAIAQGAVREIEPELASRLVFGMVNSITEWLRPSGEYDAPALADTVVGLVFEGLRGPVDTPVRARDHAS